MAEMPDVIPGEIIETEWGNDIRDRTIQRYASAAVRTSDHPSPAAGDLSFLDDTGLVYVFASAWLPVGGFHEVNGSAAVSYTTTASMADAATVSLAIPATWDSWECTAQAFWETTNVSGGSYNFRLRIDGTDQTLVNAVNFAAGLTDVHCVMARRTGMTTTGSRSVSLRAQHNGSVVNLVTGILIARAVQTA